MDSSRASTSQTASPSFTASPSPSDGTASPAICVGESCKLRPRREGAAARRALNSRAPRPHPVHGLDTGLLPED